MYKGRMSDGSEVIWPAPRWTPVYTVLCPIARQLSLKLTANTNGEGSLHSKDQIPLTIGQTVSMQQSSYHHKDWCNHEKDGAPRGG